MLGRLGRIRLITEKIALHAVKRFSLDKDAEPVAWRSCSSPPAPKVFWLRLLSLRRRFPPPSLSGKLDAMTRPTKSKIEAIKPDQQDFDAVEKEYGPLPPAASQAVIAERYRLAQAAKVIRQLEQVALSGKTKRGKSKQ
jgi:hypothetical protein